TTYLEEFDYDDEDYLVIQMLLNDNSDLVILRFIQLRCRQNAANCRPRRRQRHHLTRPELQQTPMDSSGWQSIYQSHEDRAFIHVLGIDVATFKYLMDSGFCEARDTRPIKQTGTNQAGASHSWWR
ncbi:hypothetical protein FRC11_014408, partial [Ceratobasidium sp. 423]